MTDVGIEESGGKPGGKRSRILYATLLLAAIAIIIFSIIGIATMTGLLPSAFSEKRQVGPESAGQTVPAAASDAKSGQSRRAPAGAANANASCADCGVVESIRVVDVQGEPSALGAVAGGVIGGIVGSQVGGGRGRTAMTVVGAGAGAYAGHEIEKNMSKSSRYQIRVRMDDGAHRTFYQRSQPALAVGQKVRVTENGVVPAEQVAGRQ